MAAVTVDTAEDTAAIVAATEATEAAGEAVEVSVRSKRNSHTHLMHWASLRPTFHFPPICATFHPTLFAAS